MTSISHHVRAAAVNSGWLLGDRVLRLIANLISVGAVARSLGVSDFGVIGTGLATMALLGTVATAGLQDITNREVLAERHPRAMILVTSMTLSACVAWPMAGLALIVALVSQDPMLVITAILATSLAFRPLEMLKAASDADLSSKNYVVLESGITYAFAASKIVAASMGWPLTHITAIYLSEFCASSLILAALWPRQSRREFSHHLRPSLSLARDMTKSAMPLLAGALLISAYMRTGQIIVAIVSTPDEAGMLAAATRVSESWYFVPTALTISLTPLLYRLKVQSPERYRAALAVCYQAAIYLPLIIATVISLFAPEICRTLFGSAFNSAAPVLALHSWSGIMVSVGILNTRRLVLEGRASVITKSAAVGLITAIVLNFIFAKAYGAVGSAFATVIAYLVSVASVALWSEGRESISHILSSLRPYELIRNARILTSP